MTRIAAELGLARSTIHAYRSRRQMPDPDGVIGRTPWWWASTIIAWRPNRF